MKEVKVTTCPTNKGDVDIDAIVVLVLERLKDSGSTPPNPPDTTQIVNIVVQQVLDQLPPAQTADFRINKQNDDYTLVADDLDGNTIVVGEKAGDQSITVIKPQAETVGRSVTITKDAGDMGTTLTLVAGDGVTFSPPDVSPLRRVGSTATLVYIGNGKYLVRGELP